PPLTYTLALHDALPICWTKHRRPVRLMFAQEFQQIGDAIAAERQLKGWSRAKKEALIAGKFHLLPELARRARRARAPSFETPPEDRKSTRLNSSHVKIS